jgi:hypothetical protein
MFGTGVMTSLTIFFVIGVATHDVKSSQISEEQTETQLPIHLFISPLLLTLALKVVIAVCVSTSAQLQHMTLLNQKDGNCTC